MYKNLRKGFACTVLLLVSYSFQSCNSGEVTAEEKEQIVIMDSTAVELKVKTSELENNTQELESAIDEVDKAFE